MKRMLGFFGGIGEKVHVGTGAAGFGCAQERIVEMT
jgi:hypothetical protein